MPNIISNVELGDGSIYEINDPSAENTLLAHAARLLALETKLATVEEGAEVNQDAFGIIQVGSTNIRADNTNDILKLIAGDNIILTPNDSEDSVTITANVTAGLVPNSRDQAGVVSAPGNVSKKVWKTDTAGNPAWRDDVSVIDNVISTDAGAALSANQGRLLKNLIDAKASNQAITNITRNGTTFTATRADGTTFTFTQQDLVGPTYAAYPAAQDGQTLSLVMTGEKYTWNNKAPNTLATTTANGLMSATDKTKLNTILATHSFDIDNITIEANASNSTIQVNTKTGAYSWSSSGGSGGSGSGSGSSGGGGGGQNILPGYHAIAIAGFALTSGSSVPSGWATGASCRVQRIRVDGDLAKVTIRNSSSSNRAKARIYIYVLYVRD